MAEKAKLYETALRQGYQGLTLGFGDEMIDVLASRIASMSPDLTYDEALSQARKMTKEGLASDVKDNPKTALVSNALGMLPTAAVGGARYLPQIAMGAASGFGSADGNISDRVEGAGIGAAFGLGGQAIARGIGNVTKGFSGSITPEVQKVAAKLKSMGIPVRLSQLMDSKFLSAVDSAIAKVPFSGAGKSQEAQRKAFTKLLSNTFGENADTLTDDVLGAAKTRLGGEYDKILGGKVIPIDRAAFAQGLAPLVDDFGLQSGNKAWANELQDSLLNTLDNNISQAGGLTGQSYKAMRGTLKGASATNAKARDLLKYLDDTVRNMAPDDIASQLGKVDGQYRNMKVAEKLYGQLQNSGGAIRPETLYNAAKPNISDLAYGGGGELGDLARVGRQLKTTIPDSGTATQLAGLSALGSAGVGAFFEPTIAMGALGTVGLARGLNSAMTSKYLQEGMSPALQKFGSKIASSGDIPSLLRTNQQQSNFADGAPQDDFSDIEALLQQDNQVPSNEDFSDIEAILSTSDAQTTETLPPVNSPFLARVAQAESGGNPNARNPNSSASGEYQFTDPTWKGMVKNYGAQTGITLADKNNPDKQKIMAELLTQENTNAYKNAGIEPNEADLYAAHFLGGPSAVKAKKNPEAYGAALFPQAAKANQSIFYNKGRPRTNAEINRLLGAKVGV